MGLTLYHAPGTCAFAPLVALEEAGAAFSLVMLSLADGEQRRPEHLAIHPLGRVPALAVDGNVVTETIAILSWIHASYPAAKLLPADPLQLARAHEIMAWIASSVHVALAGVRRPERFSDDPVVRNALAAAGRAAFSGALDRRERFAARRDAVRVGDDFRAVGAYSLGRDSSRYPAWEAKTRAALAWPSVRRALNRELSAIALLAA